MCTSIQVSGAGQRRECRNPGTKTCLSWLFIVASGSHPSYCFSKQLDAPELPPAGSFLSLACPRSTEGTKLPASGAMPFHWELLQTQSNASLLFEILTPGQAVGDSLLKHSTFCLLQRQCWWGEAPKNMSHCQGSLPADGRYRITGTSPQVLLLSVHTRPYPLIYSDPYCLAYPSHLLSLFKCPFFQKAFPNPSPPR